MRNQQDGMCFKCKHVNNVWSQQPCLECLRRRKRYGRYSMFEDTGQPNTHGRSGLITKTVRVTQDVEVTVDESKFDSDFIDEFFHTFFPFTDIDDHIVHIAQMRARGIFDIPDAFVEGYGLIQEMGIVAKVVEQGEEILD